MSPRLLVPKAMWDKALDDAQKTVPWYDLPFAMREFMRMLQGLRA